MNKDRRKRIQNIIDQLTDLETEIEKFRMKSKKHTTISLSHYKNARKVKECQMQLIASIMLLFSRRYN